MDGRFSRFGVAMLVMAAVPAVALVASQPSQAQGQNPGPTSQAQQQQHEFTPASFLANPSELLKRHPEGGARLISEVRDLAVADPGTLQSILNLLADANKDQKSAIGAGLAQAAKIVLKSDPSYANDIQQAVAQTKDEELVLAYTAAAGDYPTGAVGGGGGQGGGVGGQTEALFGRPSGTGGPEPIGSNGVPTGPYTITSFVGPSGFVFGTDTSSNGGSSSSQSVSPSD